MPGTVVTETTDASKILQFTEDDHRYVAKDKKTGEEVKELISSTTLIGQYFPAFDADDVAQRVAAKRGVTPEQLKAEWKAAGEAAAAYGTRVHEYMEDLLRGRTPRNTPQDERERIVFGYGAAFAKKLKGMVTDIECEKTICDIPVGIAGTIDLFCRDARTQERIIFDWKTNKKISMNNDFGKHGFPPIEHIPDCEFGHYSLQLNLYEFILKHAGYIDKHEHVRKVLVHLHKDTGASIINVPDKMPDIQAVLADYLTKKGILK